MDNQCGRRTRLFFYRKVLLPIKMACIFSSFIVSCRANNLSVFRLDTVHQNHATTHVTMKRIFNSSERSFFEIGLEMHWNASAEERRDAFQNFRRFKRRV